jgi:hypothetical protein
MDTHDVPTTEAGGKNPQWILDTRPVGKLTGTLPTGSSAQEQQNGLHEEIKQLQLEVERLRGEQKASQRTPQSNDLDADEVEDHESDDSNVRDPADRGGVLHRRPVKLALALVVAAIVSVGGLRFWNYLQSYEWTDDVEIGARVINLSVALVQQSGSGDMELGRALDHTARKGVVVVAAAGNEGTLSSSLITRHPWVIPVVAYDLRGHLMPVSNLGGSIGRRGVGAAGEGVTSLRAAGGSLTLGGTSVATPFVTGAVALLWSCFPDASAAEIKLALSGALLGRHAIAPPLLDAESAYEALASRTRSISLWENAHEIDRT